jgi:hypothetical protein
MAGASNAQARASASSVSISAVYANPTLHAVQLFIGVASSLLGGYVAARIAKRDEILNGALSSLLCPAIGVYSLSSGKIVGSLSEQSLLLLSSPVIAALGGYLRSASGRAQAL